MDNFVKRKQSDNRTSMTPLQMQHIILKESHLRRKFFRSIDTI